MSPVLRRPAASLAIIAILLTGAPPAFAATKEAPVTARSSQDAANAKARPWLYENSDVPIDAAWTFGTLSNGLRYAVRRNGVPPGQVSVRLRIDAGSLMERPDELGYAHYMEHLTFRGSRHVPDGESKRIWQRLGVTFGSDSNAQTTPTGTSYALDLPQANEQSLGESMKILAGMMTQPNIVASAVAAEKAVVLAERREGDGPQTRISDISRQHFFAGQPLATHSPIGTVETINAATAEKMEAFHARWYRPENAVIAISGDIEPALAEKLIKDNFGQWQGEGTAAAAPDFGEPDPKAPATRVAVEPGVPLALTLAWLRPWKPRADTIIYNQDKLTDMLALQIIGRRLEHVARGGGSFLQASVEQQDVSRSADGTFVSIIPSGGGDWGKALTDVRGVIEDAKATPPSVQEIEREYAQMDTALSIQVENADTEAGARQASDLVSAVDIRETTVSPQAALDIFRAGKPAMTPQKIQDSTRRLFSAGVFRALLVTGKVEEGLDKRFASAVAAPVKAATGARLADKVVTMDDLPPLGAPGKVVSRVPVGLEGMEAITFANGVRLILFPNDAETEKVRINVRFGHGQQAFSPTKPVANWAGDAVVASGIGKLGQRELDDLTNGRRIGMDFSVDDDAFEMAAVTRPADYRDQLRLFATKLAAPGWDPAPIARVKSSATIAYDALSRSPNAVLTRDLNWLLRDKDVRYRTPSREEIAALTPEAFRATWEPILASGPIEVQLFGQVKADEAIAAVAATLGALPPRPDTPVPAANKAQRFPGPVKKPVILRHNGDKEQAAAVFAWPTSGGFTMLKEARQLEILTQIFNDRLFEGLRSTDGAAYSPNVQNSWPFSFDGGGYILVTSQVRPDRVGYFYKVVADTAADLASKPVSDDELQRAVAPMRQMLMRMSTGNAFWMSQMEGATRDPRYIEAMKSMPQDLLSVTPAQLQALARKYLVPAKGWSTAVLPEGVAAK